MLKWIKHSSNWLSSKSLGTKIYFTLAAILIPVFSLIIFLQIRVTQPLLEDEVKQIGLSICRSLGSDILAQSLLSKPDQLETKIIGITWQEPYVFHLSVLVKDPASDATERKMKVLASNIENETVPPADFFDPLLTPSATLQEEESLNFWEIYYPIQNKSGTKIIAFIHTRISLQMVSQVTAIFSRISTLGGLLAILLLVWSLSYFLKRVIENERQLTVTKSENVELQNQLHTVQQQLFLNEKLAVMGQLTASIAHEIGTPLNSLSGHLHLLQDEIQGENSLKRIGVINSQVSRIEKIVKDFLAFTHTPKQQTQLVEIRSIVERILDLITPRLQSLRVQVQIFADSQLRSIRVVPTDIEQILLNLTNNALDALSETTKFEKHLNFHLRSTADVLEIAVEDNGEGINESEIKNVLKPFFTTKAPGKGTGLGLTISQDLVKKYRGKMDFQSVLGKGTTVTVKIPYDTA